MIFLSLPGWLFLTTFIFNLALVPLLLMKIPVSYFANPRRHGTRPGNKICRIHYALLWTLRNLAGLTLVGTGLIMLILPGQGILTTFPGLFIADFPRRRALEHVLIRRPTIFHAINWIRSKKGVEPLDAPT